MTDFNSSIMPHYNKMRLRVAVEALTNPREVIAPNEHTLSVTDRIRVSSPGEYGFDCSDAFIEPGTYVSDDHGNRIIELAHWAADCHNPEPMEHRVEYYDQMEEGRPVVVRKETDVATGEVLSFDKVVGEGEVLESWHLAR